MPYPPFMFRCTQPRREDAGRWSRLPGAAAGKCRLDQEASDEALSAGGPGTHDNSTSQGWWEEDASKDDKKNFKDYLGLSKVEDVPYKFIEVGMRSVARTTIFTMQVCALAVLGATAQLISFPLPHIEGCPLTGYSCCGQ